MTETTVQSPVPGAKKSLQISVPFTLDSGRRLKAEVRVVPLLRASHQPPPTDNSCPGLKYVPPPPVLMLKS